jgi:glucose-6-phosphate isomerase
MNTRSSSQATVWNINPFDQWGVELGKELAQQRAPIVSNPTSSTQGLNSSTNTPANSVEGDSGQAA